MSRQAVNTEGIAALRQRLFFATTLAGIAERELAGEALNRQAVAMACRNGAILQLHGVLTGLLDDIAVRLRLETRGEVRTLDDTRRALAARGLASPEFARVEALLAADSWLAACVAEAGRCLSSTPGGRREAAEGHDHDHEHDQPGGALARRIGMVEAVTIEPLSAEDFARIRAWARQWQSLLDDFLGTLAEF